MDRRNGWIFLGCYVLIFLAAPVLYIGVVQAALFHKLGASATVASLPLTAYQFGQFAPLVFSWLVPHRFERATVVAANAITALLLLLVLLCLILPAPAWLRISLIIAQGLLQGLSGSTSQVFMIQCLGRGTTLEGRARALQKTYSLGPVAAVASSLAAQTILNPGLPALSFPYDFALIYAIAVPCIAGVALLASRFELAPLADEPRRPFWSFLWTGAKDYAANRSLALLWIAYLSWYCTIGGMPNFSLYTKEVLGEDPKNFSGVIMALRFGCKALGGVLLGAIAVRAGLRPAAMTAAALAGAGALWAWLIPGYPYLFAFGILGAGELGGIYIPNLALSLSAIAAGPRNLAILTLATPASSFSPAAHGQLTDSYGFPASFAFGALTAGLALLLMAFLRAPRPEPAPRG